MILIAALYDKYHYHNILRRYLKEQINYYEKNPEVLNMIKKIMLRIRYREEFNINFYKRLLGIDKPLVRVKRKK